jgi:hypothetical protein
MNFHLYATIRSQGRGQRFDFPINRIEVVMLRAKKEALWLLIVIKLIIFMLIWELLY